MFDENEVPAFEVRVVRQSSDIAVVALWWNEEGHMEVVTGKVAGVELAAVVELLAIASQAIRVANWKSVADMDKHAAADPVSEEPPF